MTISQGPKILKTPYEWMQWPNLELDEIPNKWACRLDEWISCTIASLMFDDAWQDGQ